MALFRSARWLVLALVLGAAAQQLALAQYPPIGTTRTGTFVWDGARWVPAEQAQAAMPVSPEGGVSVAIAPPPLPVYVQPPCPQPDLIWMPGYWHHGLLGFYWVPGAWVPAPYSGALWTPGYWGWTNGLYFWHEGYWGLHIGYYGGVNYGFGYGGVGFAGGEWRGGHFAYNTAVTQVNVNIVHVTYVNQTIVQQGIVANPGHVAFSGGPGGIQHQPTPQEQVAEHEQHVPPTSFQQQHIETAKADKTSYASANGGHPHTLAVAKPLPAESHPAPPEAAGHATPAPAPHPTPAPAPHPTPAAHPEPVEHPPVSNPVYTPHPAPAPAENKGPVTHPTPEPTPHAGPVAHPTPEPKPKPAPKPKPEPKTKPKPEK
jgi:hypothetical protein